MLLASVGKFIPSSWKRLNPASAMEQVKLSGGAWSGPGGPWTVGDVLESMCCPEAWLWGVQLVDRSKGGL